jgi:hypothetical protein
MSIENMNVSVELFEKSSFGIVKNEIIEKLKKAKKVDEVVAIYNEYLPILWVNRTLESVKSAYRDIRVLIKNNNLKCEKIALDVFVLSPVLNNYIRRRYETKVKNRVEDTTTLPKISISYFDNKIADIVDKLENNKILYAKNQGLQKVRNYYISILIALCTGSRFVEVLKSLKIAKRGYKCVISGVAKKTTVESELMEKQYPITPLIDVELLKKYLKELRATFDVSSLNNRQIADKYNKTFNDFLRKVFDDCELDITFHSLRALYGEILYQKHGKNKMDRSRFLTEVLRHEQHIMPSECYIKFDGSDDIDNTDDTSATTEDKKKEI